MTIKCKSCGDTGRLPGSAYLDCTHCPVAVERCALEFFVHKHCKKMSEDDLIWAVHQRALRLAAGRVYQD